MASALLGKCGESIAERYYEPPPLGSVAKIALSYALLPIHINTWKTCDQF